jgi:hypothetical protein
MEITMKWLLGIRMGNMSTHMDDPTQPSNTPIARKNSLYLRINRVLHEVFLQVVE